MTGYYDDMLNRVRYALINNALRMADNNHTRAAKILGMNRTRLLGILAKQKKDLVEGLREREAVELIK